MATRGEITAAKEFRETIIGMGYGHDLMEMPDDELVQRLKDATEVMAEVFQNMGASAGEALVAFERISEALK